MAEMKHQGGCQCGAVRYEAKLDIDNPIACNCSRCGRLGLVLSFIGEDQFSLLSGEDSLTEYLFNKHSIRHQFCKVCGVQSFARGRTPDGAPMVAINVRCVDGIDAHALAPQRVDGRSF